MATAKSESSPCNGLASASQPGKKRMVNTSTLPFFRFLAACIVVFFHFGQKIEWYPKVPDVFKAGSLMVTFFFVLSGFLLYLGYSQKSFSLRQYILKRTVKILPLYYLAFVISVGVLTVYSTLPASEFFRNLFCLQSWQPYPLTVNFTSWFVSVLMFCYAVFPLILFFLKKNKPKGWVVLFASMLLWAVTQWFNAKILNAGVYIGNFHWTDTLLYYFPLFHFCTFFMGICGAYCFVTWDWQSRSGGTFSALITCVLLLTVAMMVQFQPEIDNLAGYSLPFSVSFYAPLMLLLLWHLMLTQNPLLKILAWPKFKIMGEISYALFILQAPLDKLDTYVFSPHYVMGPVTHFILFFTVLLFVSFLAAWAEKAVAKRVARRLTMTNGFGRI
jgi:peptidoglycan/LPS O-acetylase OafA/YrhL